MAKRDLKSLFKKARQNDEYWVADAIHSFTEDLVQLMKQRNVNKAELARRVERSPAYITKALGGDTNFTIETMVRLARALDGQLHLCVRRREDDSVSFTVTGQSARRTEPRPVHAQYRNVREFELMSDQVLEAANEPVPAVA